MSRSIRSSGLSSVVKMGGTPSTVALVTGRVVVPVWIESPVDFDITTLFRIEFGFLH